MGDAKKAITENERVRQQILDTLGQLGRLSVQDDSLVFQGTKFILPATMEGRVEDAVRYLTDWQRSQEQRYTFRKVFRYRPWDGAAAFDRAMKRVFGTSGIGQSTKGFGGENPPELVTVETGVGQSIQVPWGEVEFSPLEAEFDLDSTRDAEFGVVFELTVRAPKKYRAHFDAFFKIVEEELRERSIYRGKAITAADAPTFINTTVVDSTKVVYSDEVMRQLDANLWSAIRHPEVLRSVGLPLKRQVLLYGPYGTGKTLAGVLTAQQCEAKGWTFIQVRVGQDDLYEALRTAQIYAPAVVMFEDVDQVKTDKTDGVAKLLDALDGVSNKGSDVMALFTTNHVDRLHKGMMRPGRLDAVIELAGLDGPGIRRLVEATVPTSLIPVDIDWQKITEHYSELLPAFAKEALDRALRYAIAREGAIPKSLSTVDLTDAADGIKAQVAMMEVAPLATDSDTLSAAMKGIVGEAVRGHALNLNPNHKRENPALVEVTK